MATLLSYLAVLQSSLGGASLTQAGMSFDM